MIYNIKDCDTDGYIKIVRDELQGKERFVYISTFGCQQNEADSEKLLGLSELMGYKYTDDPDMADLVIFNTCAIREHAEEKALSMLATLFKRSAKSISDLYELTFCPRSVISLTPFDMSSLHSEITSALLRLLSLPRTYGTIQYEQKLLHPYIIETQALCPTLLVAGAPS